MSVTLNQQLLNAAYFDNIQKVRRWIAEGANVNHVEERDGWCAIHYAVRWNNLEMLFLLIRRGADIHIKTNDRETALHLAARWNRREIAVVLLDKGINIEQKNNDGKRAADMTEEPEMNYLLKDFESYKRTKSYVEVNNKVKKFSAPSSPPKKTTKALNASNSFSPVFVNPPQNNKPGGGSSPMNNSMSYTNNSMNSNFSPMNNMNNNFSPLNNSFSPMNNQFNQTGNTFPMNNQFNQTGNTFPMNNQFNSSFPINNQFNQQVNSFQMNNNNQFNNQTPMNPSSNFQARGF